MSHIAICFQCISDPYLQATIRKDGEPQHCAKCDGVDKPAFDLQQLAEVIQPAMRDHFQLGTESVYYDEDESRFVIQKGMPICDVVQTVLRQELDFIDEIAEAVIESEFVSKDQEPFWDDESRYVEEPLSASDHESELDRSLIEIRREHRFFSSRGRNFFQRLFRDVDEFATISEDPGLTFFRARSCDLNKEMPIFMRDPSKEVGAPPAELARAGRMNPEGIPVFYGSTDVETCLAELRPAISGHAAVAQFRTTRKLRLLDFRKLEALDRKLPSYFYPDRRLELQRYSFLRRMHALIAKPIVPGKETEYLMTQMMAEYLGHLHEPRFDGVIFQSAQRAGGINIALFSTQYVPLALDHPFPTEYIQGTLDFFRTTAIQYQNVKIPSITLSIDPDADHEEPLDI